MKVDGTPYRTIWLGADGTTVQVIDQTLLPHQFVVRDWPLAGFVAVNCIESASALKPIAVRTGTLTVWRSGPPGVKVSVPAVAV